MISPYSTKRMAQWTSERMRAFWLADEHEGRLVTRLRFSFRDATGHSAWHWVMRDQPLLYWRELRDAGITLPLLPNDRLYAREAGIDLDRAPREPALREAA